MDRYEPLTALLSWDRSAAGFLEELGRTRLIWIARRLGQAIASAEPAAAPPSLEQLWSELSLNAIDHVLRSPGVWQAVRVGTTSPSLRQRLTAEHILDRHPELHYDAWSALGDVWLGETPPVQCESVTTQCANGRFCGPSLACGIPIDLSLPAVLEFPSAGVLDPRIPGAASYRTSVERLNEAVSLIRASSHAAFEAVLDLTTNLVLRTEQDEPARLRSASSAAALGRTVLVNAHAESNSVALLAEVLVHEATHAAISSVELNLPLVTDPEFLLAAVVRSPWTNAALPVHAFLHACLVWFALARFWSRVECAAVAPAEASARIKGIRTGFEMLRVERSLDPYRRWLDPDAVSLLHSIQERALTI